MKNFSLTLYAFHLCQTFPDPLGQPPPDASVLWKNLAKLGEEELLRFQPLKDLLSKLISHQNGNDPKCEPGRPSDWLTDSGALALGSMATKEGFRIKGTLEPFLLNDTYAADLTLSPESPDIPIEVPQVQHFNPQGRLLPSSIGASVGQTLWLYGEVDAGEDCGKLAEKYAVALVAGTSSPPVLVKEGKLFGSLLFEYEANDRDDPLNPAKQCHILVSLNNSQAPTPKLAGDAYDWLLNLLCCRHKILYVEHQSRLRYQHARQQYSDLEKQGHKLSELPAESEERLTTLKKLLTEVSEMAFKYERYLRDLQAHLTALETNTSNYESCLKEIKKITSRQKDDLELWDSFLNRSSNKFQKQIQVDLNYLKPGRELFQQLIVTARGLVEIEQAKCDRERVEAEKKLENTIKTVGVGMAAGTSTASITSTNLNKSIDVYNKHYPTPVWIPMVLFPIAVLVSIALGLIVGYIGYWVVNNHYNKSAKTQT